MQPPRTDADPVERQRRLKDQASVHIKTGMAGVIYLTADRASVLDDEAWLRDSFESTPRGRRCEWHSDDAVAVTQEHVDEAGGVPGGGTAVFPTYSHYEGLAFGQSFGPDQGLSRIDSASVRLLEAYDRQKASAFNDVNGGWACVIWDRTRRQASFIRDSAGIQTLYAARLPDRVVFSTDLRILSKSGLLGDLDAQAVAEYLHFLYVPAPRTLIEGVNAVLPGHVLSFDGGPKQNRFGASRFVRGARLGGNRRVDNEIAAALPDFEEHLIRAVSDCVPATGRVALALSGGKDSSSLAVALSKVCRDRVLAFNVGSADARYDETSDAALVSRTLGLEFHSYVPTDRDLADGLGEFLAVQDMPTADPAAFPYFLAMARLPDDCQVIFDGTGNDYYFGIPAIGRGLHRYRRRLEIERNVPPAIWKLLLRMMGYGPPWVRDLRQYWSEPIEETFVAWHGWSAADLEHLYGRKVSFADTYLWTLMKDGAPDRWIELLTEVICSAWEPHTAIRKAAHFAHAVGKGIRFPFADIRLVRFINSLPSELKFYDGQNKVLLRAFMARHLPKETVAKPKAPFVFDLNRVLQNPISPWVEDLHERGYLRVLPAWNELPIRRLLERYRAEPGNPRWQHRLYALSLLAGALAIRVGWIPPIATHSITGTRSTPPGPMGA